MSKQIFELLIHQRAEKELARIEHKNRTWKIDFIRKIEIWEYIAMQINSTDGKEHQFWCIVMDLYHIKYSQNP